MNTIRRLIHREGVRGGFVTLAFWPVLSSIWSMNCAGLAARGQTATSWSHALLFVALSIPSHLYELLPITVLIGTIL